MAVAVKEKKAGSLKKRGTPSNRRPADYRSQTRPTWCPGCGDFGVLAALQRALAQLDKDPKDVVLVSGIGCSGRLPKFFNAYGLHGVHGRALPTAMGIKLANPDLTVIAVGGDGDGFAIGGGHVPHAVRRNVDLTYVVMDNQVYGLTKGQPSPTTPGGMTAVESSPSMQKMTPHAGLIETPLNLMAMVLCYGSTFAARGFSGDPKQLADLCVQALNHPGFSFIQAMSPCPTFYNTQDAWKESVVPLEDHDPGDRVGALQIALTETRFHTGLFCREERPSFDQAVGQLLQHVQMDREEALRKLVDSYA